MKIWERPGLYPIEVQNRHIKMLRYASGVLVAASLVSAGFMKIENNEPQHDRRSVGTALPALSPKIYKHIPPTTELLTTTTSKTLAGILEHTVSSISLKPTTTAAMPAPKTNLESNRTTGRASAQSLSRDDRCEQAITDANVEPAPGYYITCGPAEKYNTPTDGDICPIYWSNPAPTEPEPTQTTTTTRPKTIKPTPTKPGPTQTTTTTQPETVDPTPSEPEPDPYDCDAGMGPGKIRIHPDKWDSRAEWEYVVKHEVGHSYCVTDQQDYTEPCADTWAHAH